MKANIFGFLFIWIVTAGFCLANPPDYQAYDWESSRSLYKLTPEEAAMEVVVLKDKRAVEFFNETPDGLSQYILHHSIIRVNSDKAIAENNRIYIPSGSSFQYVSHKVRVLTPDGRIRTLSDADIREATDEKTRAVYRFFALEGLEKGSEIEHLYLMNTPVNYTGTREIIQSDELRKNVEFELISPVYLTFKIKSYNGLPQATADTSRKDKNVLRIQSAEIEPLKEEAVSAYTASLQQLIYKLESNSLSGRFNLITYAGITSPLVKNVCYSAGKNELKKVKKLVQQLQLKQYAGIREKISAIEQHIKHNIMVIENPNPVFGTIAGILDNKVGSEDGLVKLYAAIFNEAGIDYELVLTSDRSKLKFDPDFEAYNFLSAYLFYFPELKVFLSPSEVTSSLGYIPANYTANYGWFMKKIQHEAKSVSAEGRIEYIAPIDHDRNFSNHYVFVNFTDNILNPVVDLEYQLGGYYANYFQPYYSYMSPEDVQKTNEAIIHNYITNAEITSVKAENAGREYFGKKPFIVKSSLTSDQLVEKAGNKYLFKVGDLIGPQMEMYQEEKRKLDIENDFMRLYRRQIRFELPAGYKIANPEALNMDVHYKENDDKIIAFISSYKQEGNHYIIEVEEYYKKLYFPVRLYEDYRRVINAAADFNKITLIIEKI